MSLSKKLPIILMVVFIGILLFGNLTITNTTKITTLLSIVAFPFLSINGLLMMLAFLLPVNSGISSTYIFPYILVLIAFKELKQSKGKVRNASHNCLIIILIIYEIIMNIAVDKAIDNQFILYATCLVFLFHCINLQDLDFRSICIAYATGTALLLLCAVLMALNSGLSIGTLGAAYDTRIGMAMTVAERTALISDNANNLGYYSIVAISILLLLIRRTKLWERVFLVLLLGICLFGGIFTVSRTWLALLVLVVAMTICFGYDWKSKISYTLLICAVGFYLVSYLMENTMVFESMLSRFEDMSRFNSRTYLMEEYFEFLRNNPVRIFTGTGALTYKQICNASNSVHNGTQQLLICYGVFGMIWFLIELFKPIFRCIKSKKFKMWRIVPFISGFAFVQMIQLVNPCVLMLPLMICILFMKIPEANGNERSS